jgi:hypothetical protein
VLSAVVLSVRGSQLLVGTSEAQVESLLGSPDAPDASVVKDVGVLVGVVVVLVVLVVLVVVLVALVVVVGAVVVVVVVVVVVSAVVDVVEPWHELPGHGLELAEAPGVTRAAVAPARLRIVRSEKMAASLDMAAALQVDCKVVPCHRRPIIDWHPLIEALEAGLCALECPEGVSGVPRSGIPDVGLADRHAQ